MKNDNHTIYGHGRLDGDHIKGATTMKQKYQQVKTIKEYSIEAFGYKIVIPIGSIVSNSTACGIDNNFRFWQDWKKQAKKLTGYKDSILAHDLNYRGINIPAEYCEPYK